MHRMKKKRTPISIKLSAISILNLQRHGSRVQFILQQAFVVVKENFETSDGIILVLLLSTLTYFTPFSTLSIIEFEQVNVSWVLSKIN